MNEQEMRDLIQSVCDQFRRDTGLSVTQQAVEELLKPTVPHLRDVTGELRDGRISTDLLRKSLQTVLNNAQHFAKERKQDYIGFQDVKDSMAKECPYVFWC